MNASNKNYESPPEASNKPESPTSASQHSDTQFKDSGYIGADDSTNYEYAGDKDFILFDKEEDVNGEDEDYCFNEEDAVDIASTKANYGSVYNKDGNSSSGSYSQYQACYHYEFDPQNQVEEVEVEEEDPEDERPRHRFSTPPTTTTTTIPEEDFNMLDDWEVTHHRHEYIAYPVKQLPTPTDVFQSLQQSWDYTYQYPVDIELS